jgi:hypothetical protein
MRKTSVTDPIRVDWIPVPEARSAGRLGITIAPGKKASGSSGPWNRDLGTDLRRLRQVWKVDTLVTLLPEHELDTLGIPKIGAGCAPQELEWRHLPVEDGGVPDQFDSEFTRLLSDVVGQLRRGRRVVLHCRGGLGRAGTIAACTLVAMGATPAEAIRRVRSGRSKKAIETRQQEEFIHKNPWHILDPIIDPCLRDVLFEHYMSELTEPVVATIRSALVKARAPHADIQALLSLENWRTRRFAAVLTLLQEPAERDVDLLWAWVDSHVEDFYIHCAPMIVAVLAAVDPCFEAEASRRLLFELPDDDRKAMSKRLGLRPAATRLSDDVIGSLVAGIERVCLSDSAFADVRNHRVLQQRAQKGAVLAEDVRGFIRQAQGALGGQP